MTGDRIVVVGDIVNDIVVVPRSEVRPDTDTPSTIRLRPGGSAANTAVWLGSLGARVDFVGCVGLEDQAQHEAVFADASVTAYLQISADVPTGTIVILVDGEHRTMLTERGANSLLSSSAVTDELLSHASVLHISGYSIVGGFGAKGARELIERATAAGVTVSVTPGSAGYIADFGVDRFLDAIVGTTVLFPNLAEGALLSGQTDAQRIGQALRERFEIVALTMGADGVLVFEGKKSTRVPAPTIQHIADPTGAGDALAAGFLERWVTTRDAVASAEAGAFVAARAIMLVGGRPAI
ncbi:MAG: PfkB family carbohydrate kinase [Pseudolysinimonas sp.]